jgi:hypothetical protein
MKKSPHTICTIAGCGQPHKSLGFCQNHYALQDYYKKRDVKREKMVAYNRTPEAKYGMLKRHERGRNTDITFEQFCELNIQPCHYCGGQLSEAGYSLDRKNNNLDYVFDNVVPCCMDCNYTKKDELTYEEMVNLMSFRKESQLADRMIGAC